MNILLADSDRDLLQCYRKLLTMDGHTVTAVFDGAQAVSALWKESCDIVVLEESLPRMEHDQLMLILETEKIPVIVMTDRNMTVRSLLKSPLPSAYLSFPFLPSDLTDLIRAVMEKTRSEEILTRCGVDVDVSGFCFSGTQARLTSGEIDLMRELASPVRTAGKKTRIMIQALNEKMKNLGKRTRIEYRMEKGYTLVNGND